LVAMLGDGEAAIKAADLEPEKIPNASPQTRRPTARTLNRPLHIR